MKILYWAILLVLISCISGFSEISEYQATTIIIAEAANQPYQGKLAVAEVIRRNKPKAFSSLKRPDLIRFVEKQPEWCKRDALKAWKESKNSNVSKGATHFENVKAFGMPKWAKEMEITVVIKDQTFFRKK